MLISEPHVQNRRTDDFRVAPLDLHPVNRKPTLSGMSMPQLGNTRYRYIFPIPCDRRIKNTVPRKALTHCDRFDGATSACEAYQIRLFSSIGGCVQVTFVVLRARHVASKAAVVINRWSPRRRLINCQVAVIEAIVVVRVVGNGEIAGSRIDGATKS